VHRLHGEKCSELADRLAISLELRVFATLEVKVTERRTCKRVIAKKWIFFEATKVANWAEWILVYAKDSLVVPLKHKRESRHVGWQAECTFWPGYVQNMSDMEARQGRQDFL
jgi:hypothetical protein